MGNTRGILSRIFLVDPHLHRLRTIHYVGHVLSHCYGSLLRWQRVAMALQCSDFSRPVYFRTGHTSTCLAILQHQDYGARSSSGPSLWWISSAFVTLLGSGVKAEVQPVSGRTSRRLG